MMVRSEKIPLLPLRRAASQREYYESIAKFYGIFLLLLCPAAVSIGETSLGIYWMCSSDTILGAFALTAGIIEGMIAGVILAVDRYNYFVAPTVVLTLCGVFTFGFGFGSIDKFNLQNDMRAIMLVISTVVSIVMATVWMIVSIASNPDAFMPTKSKTDEERQQFEL